MVSDNSKSANSSNNYILNRPYVYFFKYLLLPWYTHALELRDLETGNLKSIMVKISFGNKHVSFWGEINSIYSITVCTVLWRFGCIWFTVYHTQYIIYTQNVINNSIFIKLITCWHFIDKDRLNLRRLRQYDFVILYSMIYQWWIILVV